MSLVFKIKYKNASPQVLSRPVLHTPGICFSDTFVLSALIYEICAFFVYVRENVSVCACEVRGTQRPPLVIVGMNKRD